MKNFSKIKKVSLVLALCLSMLCATAKADTVGDFPDVPEDAPYAEALEFLAELGIFQGDEQGNFNPDKSITRAEVTAVICRLVYVEEDAKSMIQQIFSDVPSSHWAVGYIAKAAELDIVGGYGNGNFGPSDPVTQEQIIKMLVCARGYGPDAEQAGGWPAGYVSVAKDLQIIGDGQNITNIAATRSEVATFSYNILRMPTAYENGGYVG